VTNYSSRISIKVYGSEAKTNSFHNLYLIDEIIKEPSGLP
jgi:hypothetical protein